VLHGRAAFDGQRRMCGAYVGADEFRSKLAVLRERFAGADGARAGADGAGAVERSVWHPAL
jgi:trimethyllysine dioxygenase